MNLVKSQNNSETRRIKDFDGSEGGKSLFPTKKKWIEKMAFSAHDQEGYDRYSNFFVHNKEVKMRKENQKYSITNSRFVDFPH